MILVCHPGRAEEVIRYWIVQKDYDLDEELLASFINARPDRYEITPFDMEIYEQAMAEEWSREFCETFEDGEDYLSRGLGVGIMDNGKLVSEISTM